MATTALRPRNPLQPLAGLVTLAFRFTVLGVAGTVIRAALGYGPVFGWGGGDYRGVCVTAPADLLQRGGGLTSQALRLRAGVSGGWTWTSICDPHPAIAQSLAAALTQFPATVVFLGAFYLAQRLVRVAAREGVHTTAVTHLAAAIGWWLLAGEVVAAVIEAAARMNLLSTLVTWRMDWTQWWVGLDVSLPVVITGAAVITFARVLRLGAVMREDLEGTV